MGGVVHDPAAKVNVALGRHRAYGVREEALQQLEHALGHPGRVSFCVQAGAQKLNPPQPFTVEAKSADQTGEHWSNAT